MPRYQIPKGAGEFHIRKSYAGTLMIWNGKKSKGSVKIVCRDQAHAKEILQKLKKLKNGGEIWV